MTEIHDVSLYLLAQVMNEQVGDNGRRQFSQLKFLKEFVSFEFQIADQRDILNVPWRRVASDRQDEVIIEIEEIKGLTNRRYNVVDSGIDNRSEPIGFLETEAGFRAMVKRLPRTKTIDLKVDKTVLHRKNQAITQWQTTRHPERMGFSRLFESEQFASWPPVKEEAVDKWYYLTEDSRPGTKEQRSFVRRALGTPDFALLDGPPGSGKTTVICELIAQVIARGQRVLLCGQTHESVDNVLERLVKKTDISEVDVLPLRTASPFAKRKASQEARKYFRDEITETIGRVVRGQLVESPSRSWSQDIMLNALMGDRGDLEKFLVESANVLCGTTSGIVADPLLNPYFKAGEAVYDYLIVDETSKLTLAELLIPALLAKRWILSGDPMQLAPYDDSDEVAAWLAHVAGFKINEIDGDKAKEFKDLATELANKFSLRFVEKKPFDTEQLVTKHIRTKNPRVIRDLTSAIPKLIRLGMTSCLEQLIVRVPPNVALRETRFAGAVDLGMTESVLTQRLERLQYQQRMHSQISELVRDPVYQGRAMRDVPGFDQQREWTYARFHRRAVFVNAKPSEDDQREVNRLLRGAQQPQLVEQQVAEARVVLNLLQDFVRWVDSEDLTGREWTVGLLSFYTMGVRAIRSLLERHFNSTFDGGEMEVGASRRVKLRLSTVNAFQGREVDLVFLCIGNSRLTAFTKSVNNVNVGLTRARYQLVLVGDQSGVAKSGKGFLLGQLAADEALFWGHGI